MSEHPFDKVPAQWQWRMDDGTWTPTEPPTDQELKDWPDKFRALYAAAPQTTFTPGEPVEVRKQNDEIDEIVIRCGDVHIEQMDASGWFLGVNASDGSYHQFWFGAKNDKSHVHFRHTESSPPGSRPTQSGEPTQELLVDIWFHLSDTTDPVLRKIANRARAALDEDA